MQWKFSDLVNKELFSFPMFIKRRKTNFLQKSATKQLLAYRYGARKGNLTFFQNYSLNRGFHSLYGVKEENIFILNLTFGSCRSLYGAKKIFHSIVGNNGVAWVVRV